MARTNYCRNPRLHVDTYDWLAYSDCTVARNTDPGVAFPDQADACAAITNSAAPSYADCPPSDNRIPCALGEVWNISGYVYIPDINGGSFNIVFDTYNSDGVRIGSSEIGYYDWSTSDFVRLDFSRTITGTDPASFRIRFRNANALFTVYITNLLYEKSATLGDYFDGSSDGCYWAGTPHASISHYPDVVPAMAAGPSRNQLRRLRFRRSAF